MRLRCAEIFNGRDFRTFERRRSSIGFDRTCRTAAGTIESIGRNANPKPARMTDNFEFQFPWLLGLLALLPVYALLRGKAGKLSALKFSSAEIARASGTPLVELVPVPGVKLPAPPAQYSAGASQYA